MKTGASLEEAKEGLLKLTKLLKGELQDMADEIDGNRTMHIQDSIVDAEIEEIDEFEAYVNSMEVGSNEDAPDDVLRRVADFFEARNKEYGSAYKQHGGIMKGLFPNGISLVTEEDFYIYHCICLKVIKLTRLCKYMERGKLHNDSILDDLVYTAMMAENRGILKS